MLTPGAPQLGVLTAKLCLIELVAWGVLYYTFSVSLPSMQDELGWSSATFAAGFSAALIVSGVAAPLVGGWIDHRGSRGPMVSGALAGALGLVVWSAASSFPVYLIGWALIGVGMAGTLYAPAFAAVVRASPKGSRNAILTITVVGALASTLFMPLASVMGESMGWRSALVALASALAIVVAPLALSLPSGTSPAKETETSASSGSSRTRVPGSFRLLAGSLMLADAASVAVNVYLVVFLVEQGLSLHVAASVAGIAGAAKIGGRLATAAGTQVTAVTLMRASLSLTAIALLLPVLWPSTWAAIAMVVGFGATNGARTILRPALVVEAYGSRNFGKNNGLLQLYTTIAKATGPVGFGLLLGAIGWSWSWPALAALPLLSAALLVAVRPISRAGAIGAKETIQPAEIPI